MGSREIVRARSGRHFTTDSRVPLTIFAAIRELIVKLRSDSRRIAEQRLRFMTDEDSDDGAYAQIACAAQWTCQALALYAPSAQ